MNYHASINDAVAGNDAFRRVLATGQHAQVVAMSLLPGEEIGMEVHDVDQILVFHAGEGKSVLDGVEAAVVPGHVVYVPAGVQHNFVNTGATAMKLWTVYAPPEHRDGTIHQTKAEAEADEHDHAV